MKLKTTIRRSILTYPSLFTNGFDVLHHMFFIIGNGYDWKNGQLVDNSNKIKTIEESLLNIDKKYKNQKSKITEQFSNFSEELCNSVLDKFEKDYDEYKDKVKNVDELIEDWSSDHKDYYYTVSNSSYVNDYPEDIKPDWEEARKYMENWLNTTKLPNIHEYHNLKKSKR